MCVEDHFLQIRSHINTVKLSIITCCGKNDDFIAPHEETVKEKCRQTVKLKVFTFKMSQCSKNIKVTMYMSKAL